MTLLAVENLHTHFVTRTLDNETRTAMALNGVSFSVDGGEILGIVGETGAGKSLTAYSVMGLLRPPARIASGRIRLLERELVGLSRRELDAIRGAEMAMVVQSPRSSLDPLARVGEQLVRMARAHRGLSRAAARARAIEMLEAVGIPDPTRRAEAWPHSLSGGMAQRVLIAMALINEPRLIIADEPTTGLDVTVQAQVLDLLRDLVRARAIGAIIITHDLGVVAQYCDRMAVMFAGRIVESGATGAVFAEPAHPYTRALLAATPERLTLGRSASLGGDPPNLFALPPGCHYAPRCRLASAVCLTPLPTADLGSGHLALCHKAAVPVHA